MPEFRCEKCGHEVEAEKAPHTCAKCFSPASEAFPVREATLGETSEKGGVADRFDVGEDARGGDFEGEPGWEQNLATVDEASETGEEASAPVVTGEVEIEEAVSTPGFRPPEGLDTDGGGGDDEDSDDDGTALADDDPNVITQELSLDDLEEAGDEAPVEGPPRPPPRRRATPRSRPDAASRRERKDESKRGRIAYPLPEESGAEAPTSMPADSGGESRPRRQRLTSQTESLAELIRRRKRRRTLGLLWGLGLCVVAVAVIRTAWPPQRPAAPASRDRGVTVTIVDSGEPDLEEPDTGAGAGDGGSDLTDGAPEATVDAGRRRPSTTRKPRPGAGTAAIEREPDAPVTTPKPPGATAAQRAAAHKLYASGLKRLLVGDGKGAVDLFNQALARHPRFAKAYRGLGLAYQKLGKLSLARAAFERYLLMRPKARDAEMIRKRLQSL